MTNAEYLERLNKVIRREDDAVHLSPLAPVLAMFLADWRPGNPDTEGVPDANMTSQDIVYQLEETCQLTVNDVTAVMLYLGYRLKVDEYRGMEWAIVHKTNAADEDDSSTPPICK